MSSEASGREYVTCPYCDESVKDDQEGALTDLGEVAHKKCHDLNSSAGSQITDYTTGGA